MMGKPIAAISCLLLLVGAVTAQEAHRQAGDRLPQWLTGLIAVVGFLFLVFVSLLVKRAWCEGAAGSGEEMSSLESERGNEYILSGSSNYEVPRDMARSKDNTIGYDNLAFEATDDKITPM